jgi:hypothetical protein
MLPPVRIRPHHTFVLFACLFALPAPARAGDCGDVDALGQCLDAQTVAWCAAGKLKQETCPKGEICAPHATFNGGVGCLPPEKTKCGGVPPEGECTSAGALAWCDERGEVQLLKCGQESVCGYDADAGYYDCVPASGARRPAATDASGGDEADAGSPDQAGGDGASEASDASASAGEPANDDLGPTADAGELGPPVGPTPGIAPGAAKGESSGATDAGCAAHGGAAGWLWGLAAWLALGWTRQRRYGAVSSRSTVPRSPTT